LYDHISAFFFPAKLNDAFHDKSRKILRDAKEPKGRPLSKNQESRYLGISCKNQHFSQGHLVLLLYQMVPMEFNKPKEHYLICI
jgi:hypothetical protein